MAVTKKKSEHYVNNKEFLAAMVKYRISVNKAKRSKIEKPPVPDYIGECFLKIANHLSYRPNFINYTFRDDMISDGIENCLQYLDNFNPKTSNNPFLDSFKPTFFITTSEPLEIIVATIIKAADEKSPGTSNEFLGSSSE